MQLFHKKSILRLCYKWLKKTTTFAILEKCIENHDLLEEFIKVLIELVKVDDEYKDFENTYIRNKRHAINDFKQSNEFATSSYQNMSNQHRVWQSHFLDQKK